MFYNTYLGYHLIEKDIIHFGERLIVIDDENKEITSLKPMEVAEGGFTSSHRRDKFKWKFIHENKTSINCGRCDIFLLSFLYK